MEERITIEYLQNILEEAKQDYVKVYEKGNKSAATRLRKSLQEVAKKCKVARTEVMEHTKLEK